jgi:hypothetical protein
MTCFTSSRAHDLKHRPADGEDAHQVAERASTNGMAMAASDAGGWRSTGGDRSPAPTGSGRYRSTLMLAIGPFRDCLARHMAAGELTAADVGRSIRIDEAVVRGWFAVRPPDWREHTTDRFVVHTISETTIEAIGIALTGNPRLAADLYPHLAEPVCQHCGAPADCTHLGRDLQLTDQPPLAA